MQLNPIYKKVYLFLLLILFTLAMNFHIPNYGGSGFDLPHNGAVSFIATLLIVVAVLKTIITGTIRYSPLIFALLLLLLCLIIPGLLNYHSETKPLQVIILPLIGILFFYFSAEQLIDSKKAIITILYIICFAASIQIIYALLQKYIDISSLAVYIFSNGEKMPQPTGIFQQQNILSSFLATGVLIASYLLSRTELYQQRKNYLVISLLIFTILGGIYIILVIGSRAAIIGLIIGMILFFISQKERLLNLNKKIVIFFILSILIISAYNYKHIVKFTDRTSHAVQALSEDNTELDNRRRLVIWEIAKDTYLKAPLIGHGLGNFATEFQDQARQYNQEATIKLDQFISHPHNEILFWGIESGLLAIIALLIFMGYYLYLLFSQGIQYGLLWLGILTPIGLQTQVSLPFYLSTTHLIVFILLIVISLQKKITTHIIKIPTLIKGGLVASLLGIILIHFLFVWTLLNGILNMGAFQYTGNKVEGLLDTPLKNIALHKKALLYKKQFEFIRNYKQGKIEKIPYYIDWLNLQIQYNDNAVLYHHLFKAYLSLGKVQKAIDTIAMAKERYPYIKNQFEQLKTRTLTRYKQFQQQR